MSKNKKKTNPVKKSSSLAGGNAVKAKTLQKTEGDAISENAEITVENNIIEESGKASAKSNQSSKLSGNENKKPAKTKEKQPKKRFKRSKEIISELKKVSWPGFGKVAKKTGVVLAVVAIFTVVLFGIDYLLGLLFGLLTKGI